MLTKMAAGKFSYPIEIGYNLEEITKAYTIYLRAS